MNYFDSDISNSTNTIVNFDEKGGKLWFMFAGKVEHNLCEAGWLFYLTLLYLSITQHVLLRLENLVE